MNTQFNNPNNPVPPMGQGNSQQWPMPPAGATPFGAPQQAPAPKPTAQGGDPNEQRKRKKTIAWIIIVAILDLLLLLLLLLLPSRCGCDRYNHGYDDHELVSDDNGPDDDYFDSIPDDPDNFNPTDSVAEEVEEVISNGGQLQFTISWSHSDLVDIDAHSREPDGYHIYFANRDQRSPSGGVLDVDNKAEDRGRIEHITYQDCSRMKDGTYRFSALNYTGGRNQGVKAYLTVGNKTFQYEISSLSREGQEIEVAQVTISNGQVTNVNHRLDHSEVDVQP